MRLHPGILFLASLITAALLEDRFPAPLHLPFPLRAIIAGVVMAGSAAILFQAIRSLHAAGTPIEPNKEPKAIVTSGPFRVSRNPIYLSLIVMGIGWTFLVSSGWFLAATTAVFLLLNVVVIPREEQTLARAFPEEFNEWSRRTRRWI